MAGTRGLERLNLGAVLLWGNRALRGLDAGSTVAGGDSWVWGQHGPHTRSKLFPQLHSTSRLTEMGQLSLGPREPEWGHRSPLETSPSPVWLKHQQGVCPVARHHPVPGQPGGTVARGHTPRLPKVKLLHA